jgi:2-oxoisovalerate dehydrogenase E1 component
MMPATPADAKAMLNLALRGTDPTVFLESQRLYNEVERFEPGGVPEGFVEVEAGRPVLRRAGGDLTMVAWGAALYRALEAADILRDRFGLSVEVWDGRFAVPFDADPVIASVRRTGRALLVSDACERGSFLHTVATRIAGAAFGDLDAPVAVLGARNWITPPAEMEEEFFPQARWIVDAVHERILPLPGHIPSTSQAESDLRNRDRLGA